MATKPRQIAALVTLLALLVVLVVVQKDRLPWITSNAERAARPQIPSRIPPPAASTTGTDADGTVKVDDLQLPRPAPHATDRNPFRFGTSRPAPTELPPDLGSSGIRDRPPPIPVPPPGPPPPPPIPLKFIGVVDAPGQTALLAVMSDGRNVFHGREGDIIDGRYRILHIGTESIELAYVDGRGRQVIRLSGGGA